MYAQHNDLLQYVRFKHAVTNITFAGDHQQTGRWKVFTRNTDTSEEYCDVFDGVAICSGHHTRPLMVHFLGQEKFSGQILHTHAYKHATPFQGKRVCVVGAGNSAIDAIVELSYSAKQVYMSTRRGVWIRPRVGHRGWPTDSWVTTRGVNFLMSRLPFGWKNTILETMFSSRMDHEAYGLKPKHRILQQHPVTNDALPNCILSGRVLVRPNIKSFTEKGLVFEGETDVTEVDVVILGTGYEKEIAFIDQSIISPSASDRATGGLYKFVFSPELPHPHTLALIGMVHPLGPLTGASEIQSRWFAGLMSGWIRLPDRETMRADVQKEKEFYRQAFYESPRHTIQLIYMPYMDEIAGLVGCRPNLMKYLITDPVLWFHLVFDVFSTYQFRLQGPHAWDGARDAVVNTNNRILAPLKLQDPDAGRRPVANGNLHGINPHHD